MMDIKLLDETATRLRTISTDLQDVIAEVNNLSIVLQDQITTMSALTWAHEITTATAPQTVTVTQSAAVKLAPPPKSERAPVTKLAMLDIETLATTNDAAILEIGLAIYDLQTKKTGSYNWELNIPTQLRSGRVFSQSTIDWWKQQGKSEDSLFNQDGLSLLDALYHFAAGVNNDESIQWWAKGDFDFRIMEDAFSKFNIPFPWKYWQLCNLRSAIAIVPKQVIAHIENPRPHSALYDADYQLEQLRAILTHTRKQDENDY